MAQRHMVGMAQAAVSDTSGDVLVCKLVSGKVTFVHRRVWPALACATLLLLSVAYIPGNAANIAPPAGQSGSPEESATKKSSTRA